MSEIFLSDDAREKLEGLIQSLPVSLQKRAQLILLYSQGLPTRQAAPQAGFSSSQARYWKQQFNIHGLEIFKTKTRTIETENKHVSPAQVSIPIHSKLPGIQPDDIITEAGRKILGWQFSEMVAHEAGTIDGANIEDLHDMRVATRRMRAAFDLLGGFYSAKVIRPHVQGLKLTGRALGKVRDLDVTIEKLGHYLQTVPAEDQAGLTPLVEHWKLELEQARQEMIIHLNSQEYLDFKNNFAIFLNTHGMGKKKSEIHAPGGSNVRFLTPTLIYNRFASVMAYDSVIPMASFEQLHALRIEFKKLRYTLEFFKEILGQDVQTIIEEIKGLQDHLGELNDANVACHTLSRFLKNWDKKQVSLPLMERTNPLGIIHYLASRYAERHQLMITFPTAWQHFSRIELRQSLARSMAIL